MHVTVHPLNSLSMLVAGLMASRKPRHVYSGNDDVPAPPTASPSSYQLSQSPSPAPMAPAPALHALALALHLATACSLQAPPSLATPQTATDP